MGHGADGDGQGSSESDGVVSLGVDYDWEVYDGERFEEGGCEFEVIEWIERGRWWCWACMDMMMRVYLGRDLSIVSVKCKWVFD